MTTADALRALRDNPVRLYAALNAVLLLVALYVPALPVVAILAVLGAILGVGETVRARVTPNSRVAVHEDEVPEGYVAAVLQGWGSGE